MRDHPGRKHNGRANPSAGFLLVEVLATMTISALLLVALFSIASVATRSSGRLARETEHIESTTRIFAALSREVARAAPIRWAGKSGGFVFSGSKRSLVFAREVRLADGSTTIGAAHIESGKGLNRRVAIVSPGAESVADLAFGAPETIADGRFSLALAYYGRLPDGRETLTDIWQNPHQLPVAVRLTLFEADGTSSVLRVKLDIDAEPGCGFPKKGRCGLRPDGRTEDEAQSQSTAAKDAGDGG